MGIGLNLLPNLLCNGKYKCTIFYNVVFIDFNGCKGEGEGGDMSEGVSISIVDCGDYCYYRFCLWVWLWLWLCIIIFVFYYVYVSVIFIIVIFYFIVYLYLFIYFLLYKV